MMDAPTRIWVEDGFGDDDDDQWLYGAWDCTRQRGYQTEYILASEHARIVAEKDARIAELEDKAKSETDARKDALEAAAKVAETVGVYPELNIYGGGPEWYKHGKDIAAAIRALAEKG